MKLNVQEKVESSEPKTMLYMDGPYAGFKIPKAQLKALKTELEALRDKLVIVDKKMFAVIAKGLYFKAPKLKSKDPFEIDCACLDETFKAVRDELFLQMKFDPKPKQKKLTDKK
jgi:hypothetical protein